MFISLTFNLDLCVACKNAELFAWLRERRDISTPIKFRLGFGQGESMMRLSTYAAGEEYNENIGYPHMRMEIFKRKTHTHTLSQADGSIYGHYSLPCPV
jgi:hypothetical protein